METRKINDLLDVPEDYTGIAEYSSGTKTWWYNGKLHREDGPAVEYRDGYEEWRLEDKEYYPKNLNDFIVLDYYQGNYNLMWYKLLSKNKIIECPDIPGLITK